jgi:hypothetical protein
MLGTIVKQLVGVTPTRTSTTPHRCDLASTYPAVATADPGYHAPSTGRRSYFVRFSPSDDCRSVPPVVSHGTTARVIGGK